MSSICRAVATFTMAGMGFLPVASLAAGPAAGLAWTSAVQAGDTFSVAPSCTLIGQEVYRCGDEPFRTVLAQARTFAVETANTDRFTRRELQGLVAKLGKQPATSAQIADLTVRVVPVSASAVSMGPADQPLASLQVFARGGQHGSRTLVWDETLTGQADRPWPSLVHAVIDQFRARVAALPVAPTPVPVPVPR